MKVGLNTALFQLAAAKWNAVIPKRAINVQEDGPNHLRYLHPTKGWRRVARKRVTIGLELTGEQV